MYNAFKSEWVKVRRRALLLGAASMSVFSAVFIPLGINRATSGHRFGGLTKTVLESDQGLTTLLGRGATLTAVIALIIVASATAVEYSHGTLRNLLVREPHRLQLLTGKFAALLTFVLVATSLSFVAATAVALIFAPTDGVSTEAWTSSSGLANLLALYGNLVLATVGYSALGCFAAILFRSAAPAVAVPLAYIIVVENLIGAVWADAPQWLYGQVIDRLLNNESALNSGPSVASYVHGLTVGSVYCVGLILLTGALFRYRDVTS